MANNELVIGEPRLGWFIDGDPETDDIAVMLQDTGTVIQLTVPLKGMFARDDPYGRWWSAGIEYGDDPDRTRYSYKPPRVLLLHDNNGPVALVGCRSRGSAMGFNSGQGQIVANYAVFGASNLKYEAINGLRPEIPAMASWTRLSSMDVKVTHNEKSRVQSVQMTLRSAPSISLARLLNLSMSSSWRTERSSGSFLAYEGVKIDSTISTPRSWDEHLQVHGAVLDLVSISAWKPFGYSNIEVHRSDDAHSDGGERWLPVATHRLPKHVPWSSDPQFLFPWSEIGPRGVKRWLKLRKSYGQAIGPLLSILRSDDPWSHASVVQSGIALESLGYLIDVNKNGGAHLNSRKQMNFKPGLQVILDDMKVTPLAHRDDWIARADDSYMGTKHPDRAEPDSLVALNTLRENLLVLRFWIALQVGASVKSLSEGLRADPLSHAFVTAD